MRKLMKNYRDVWEEKVKKQDPYRVVGGWSLTEKRSRTIVKSVLNFLLKNVQLTKNMKVLDVGGGPLARFSIEFAKLGLQVTWLDISKWAQKIAKQKIKREGINKIKFIIGDATKLKFRKKFDLIFCFGTFYHIPSYLSLRTLENFYTSLKDGGFLVIDFALKKPTLIDYLYIPYIFLRELFIGPNPIIVTRFDENEINDMISRVGFKILNKKGGLYILRKEN